MCQQFFIFGGVKDIMDFLIQKGGMEDTEDFLKLLENVRQGMEHKEWFYLDPPEVLREAMQSGIMELWTAKDDGILVAGFNILRPGMAEYNYGYDLGLSEEDLMMVINMDSVAVHPDYRGRGLQRKLIQCAEAYLAGEGRHILLCTVHPENHSSLTNVLKQGYTIQKKLQKYDSVRYILRKDI